MRNTIESFFFCSLGLVACIYLRREFGLSAIIASSLIGLLGSFLPSSLKYNFKQAINSIYVGTFVAMGRSLIDSSTLSIFILCLLTSFIFSFFNSKGKAIGAGFGGRLGTIAFLASLIFLLLGVQ